MQMSLAINSSGFLYCCLCGAPIFEKGKYVLVDGSEYHVKCFTKKVEQFMSLLKETTNE